MSSVSNSEYDKAVSQIFEDEKPVETPVPETNVTVVEEAADFSSMPLAEFVAKVKMNDMLQKELINEKIRNTRLRKLVDLLQNVVIQPDFKEEVKKETHDLQVALFDLSQDVQNLRQDLAHIGELKKKNLEEEKEVLSLVKKALEK